LLILRELYDYITGTDEAEFLSSEGLDKFRIGFQLVYFALQQINLYSKIRDPVGSSLMFAVYSSKLRACARID